MRTFGQQQRRIQKATSSSPARSSLARPGPILASRPILYLQRAIGNQAVQRLLQAELDGREAACPTRDATDSAHDLSQSPAHFSARGGGCPTVQAKYSGLNISHPGDAGEIEADQIADTVMRMPAHETLPTARIQSHDAIHRKCDACEDEEEKISRKALPTAEGGLNPNSPEHVQSAISSGGNPLDRAIRNFFEPRLGSDLGAVRIHTGGAAAESAKAINAKAYTMNSHIVFGSGEYKPDSEGGKHLLAHELAHVSQSSSTATRRDTIYRQTDEGQILAEIQMLRTNLMAPVNPLAEMQRTRLIQLEAMLGKAAGKPAPPSKASPSLDLPFSGRFAQAWTQAKEAAGRKVFQEDKESGSSITRGLIKIDNLVPTPRDVWKTGIRAGLFKNDEWDRVEEYSSRMANETFEKRYKAAKYGRVYGDRDKVSGERSNTDVDIWSRGKRYGLFLPSEKAAVLNISAIGIGRAASLNSMAKTVDLNSPDAVTLRDEIHRFADDPAVVLLGPEMERLFGSYGYEYIDEPNQWYAADRINKAYEESLGGSKILGDPNASVQQRWTECLRIRNFKENNLEEAAFDPKCFQSSAEFDKEYYRRMGEHERRRVDECPSGGPDKFTCQDRIDLEYYPTGTAQKDYAMRQGYQQYQEHVESVRSGGAFATLGRLGGYVAAKAAGRDEDEALRWSEGAAAIGSFGDAVLTVKAVAAARTGFQNSNQGGGHKVSRDVPMTPPPQNVASRPTNEPIPPPVQTSPPTSTAVKDPWAGSVARPVDLSRNLQTAAPPATTVKARAAPDPRVMQQEEVVGRRIDAVKVATENHNQVSIRVNQAEAAVASAKHRVDAAKAQAETARQAAEQAAAAAQGLKRNTAESKNATAKRNEAARAERAVPRAETALKRANDDFTRARGNAARAAQGASDARAALQTSQKHLDRLRSNPNYGRRQLTVVQPERTLQGPAGDTIVDRGYEGRRGDDPPLGMRSSRWAHTAANYQRMLDGRPPVGEDGAPINLHHRTRGPMSRLDEYTEAQHRELKLHEPGLDSYVNRREFDRQRERYWVQRARDLLDKR